MADKVETIKAESQKLTTVKVDSNKPMSEQVDLLKQVDPYYERAFPELSEICEKAMREALMGVTDTICGMTRIALSEPAPPPKENDPGQEDEILAEPFQEIIEEKSSSIGLVPGLFVKNGKICVDEESKVCIPVRSEWWDPRQAPFLGDPNLLSKALGKILGTHIKNQLEMAKVKTRLDLMIIRHTVCIFGKIPVEAMKPDEKGRKLNKDAPLLQARVPLIITRVQGRMI